MKTKREFLASKKDKAFYRVVRRFIEGKELDELEVALNLNSMLTHCLIEMKENRDEALLIAEELEVDFQTQAVSLLIKGEMDLGVIRIQYKIRYGKEFGIG